MKSASMPPAVKAINAQAAPGAAHLHAVHSAAPLPFRKFVRQPRVSDMTSLGKSSIYDLMAQGKFPQRVKLGARCSVWLESEVLAWIEARAAERAVEGGAQ